MMFTALNEIVKTGEKITLELSPGPNGTMKVVVRPELGPSKIPELSFPMALCATPEELDAGFLQTVKSYQVPRLELAKQVETTNLLVGQAKKDQATKAVKALAAPAKPSKQTNAVDDATGDDQELDGDDGNSESSPETSASSTAPASTGTDLSSLF